MNLRISMINVAFILILSFFLFESVQAQKALTLDEALGIAMENSPDIRRVRLDLEQSRESLEAQEAGLKSQFSLSLTPMSYRRDRTFNEFFSTWNTSERKESSGRFMISQPIPWTDGTLSFINQLSWQDSYSEYQDISSETYSNNLYLMFSQPIFTYNRTKLQLRELELDLENARLSYDIQRLALEQLVTQRFYDVYKQKMRVDVSKEELDNQRQSHEIIKNKVDAGIAAEEELYQAELNLATSQSTLQNEKVALANVLDAFKVLIGVSLFDSISVTADISHQPVQVNLQKAIDHGLDNRMELRQRKIDIRNAQFNLTRTAAQNEFKGDISLSYGIIGTDEVMRNIYEVPTRNQRFSLSLNIPLWDWGQKESQMKASRAQLKRTELSIEDERKNIIIEIRQAFRNLQNQENQIEIARQNVRNAQLTYDINLERYKNGDLTSMDLNLFQSQLSEKKMGLVESLINYKLALLELKVKSLWDFRRDQSVLSNEAMN